VPIIWLDSADKHGIAHEDALHAMMNRYVYVPQYDDSRVKADVKPDLWVGPPQQLGGPLIEVMAERKPPRDLEIFHVMQANPERRAMADEALGNEGKGTR
jgi:hypothetical protein